MLKKYTQKDHFETYNASSHLCWLSFMPTWHRLESFTKRDSWENASIKFAWRQVYRALSWLTNDVKEANPLWAVPSLDRWSWVYKKARWANNEEEDSISLKLLLRSPPPESYSAFPQWQIVTWDLSWNKCYPSEDIVLLMVLHQHNRNPNLDNTKTWYSTKKKSIGEHLLMNTDSKYLNKYVET